MEQVSILDILYTSQQWYNWTKFFGLLSGFDSKLEDPVERYLTTVFCYGCNLGPSQTANSLDIASRKQISYINQWHIGSEKLSYSRKNKLYQAFSELGRAIRTGFLLKYISNIHLRRTIQESTNKCESFNGFTKWINFGSDGVIRENNRDEQSKMIKYNQLIANCVIFYNVYHMSTILQKLACEGYEIDKDILSSLSPYMTSHINRFGKYTIDKSRKIPELNFDITL